MARRTPPKTEAKKQHGAVQAAARRRRIAPLMEEMTRPPPPSAVPSTATEAHAVTPPPVSAPSGLPPLVPDGSQDAATHITAARIFRRNAEQQAPSFFWPGPTPEAAQPPAVATHVELPAGLVRQLNDVLGAIVAELTRIAPIVQQLEAERPSAPGIGHNQPPEPMPIGLAQVQLGISAASVMRIEISEERPRVEVLRHCGLVLKLVWKGLGALTVWLCGKGDAFLEAAVKSAGIAVGAGIVGTAAMKIVLDKLGVDLATALTLLEDWARAHGFL